MAWEFNSWHIRADQSCESCRFWSTEGIAGDGDVPGNSGDCRRHSPRLTMFTAAPQLFVRVNKTPNEHSYPAPLVLDEDQECEELRAVWPLTYAWQWCGEYDRVPDGIRNPPRADETGPGAEPPAPGG